MQRIRLLLIATLLQAPGLAAADAAPLGVEDAWVAEGPPGAVMLAGYLTLHNPGKGARVVTGVSCDAVREAEIHRTVHRDGMVGMEHQPRVEVPADARVHFEPGGLHIMLMYPRRPLRAGDRVECRLHLEDGGDLPLSAEVRRRGG